MWNYSEKLKEHFLNPRNVGEIANPDAESTVGNLMCGDALHLMLKFDDNERIVDAKFQTFGCASAIASASALTEMVKGMSIEEASRLTNDDIVEFLEGLPEAKVHCSVMGMEALQKALGKYLGKAEAVEGRIVCQCFDVTDKLIEQVVMEHDLKTVEGVTDYTKAGGGCGKCHDEIRAIIAKVRGETIVEPMKTPASRMTNLQRIKLIEEAIEKDIRPMLHGDGGDIRLVDIDGNKVYVTLLGRCASCPMSGTTVDQVIEARLREMVSPDIEVHAVEPQQADGEAK
ncbi:MAG: Fe-S cluster assembly protein NifU [Planctomycetia bacterium]|nr:Fe-S cluster assembly protein NifU [Planctomycetia bacterium]